jgi:hypothetical protein
MTRKFIFFLLSISLAVLTARASSDDGSYTRIARLSYIEGQVSFQHTSDVDWSTASINLPLQPGDRIYTGPFGRAEIEFEEGSVLRLAEGADIQLLSLKEDIIQYRVLVGLSTLSASSGVNFEIDTPAAAFTVLNSGIYRMDVYENGEVDAIVRKGELEAANNLFSRRIRSAELLHVRPGENSANNIAQYHQRDQWDEWTDRRQADRYASAGDRHLPATVYMGTSELNRYGRWIEVETYGTAWVPLYVGIGWSPYSLGRWCYRPLWGWTWVSYQPWGWLPYHYGRWHFSLSFGWCWLPGPAFSFNFWSPGLVTFYRGPGWVSWCPLGPGDYYNVNHYYFNKRVYGHHLDRMRALNTRAPGDSLNRNARGAFRTAQIKDFTDRSFASPDGYRNLKNVNQPWKQGAMIEDGLKIRPTAASYSANPDRPAVRPKSRQAFPTVVRANPAIKSSDGEIFSRITDSRVSSRSARTAQSRVNPGDAFVQGESRAIAGRSMETPKLERSDRVSGRSIGSTSGNLTDPRPAASSSAESNAGSEQRSLSSGRSPAKVQSEAAPSSNPQVAPRGSYVRRTPTQSLTQDEIRNAGPRSSNGSQNSESTGPRSGANRTESGPEIGGERDSAYSPRTYTVPRKSSSSAGSAQGSPNRVYTVPSTRQNVPRRSFERLTPSPSPMPNDSRGIQPRTDVRSRNNNYVVPPGAKGAGSSSGAAGTGRSSNPGRNFSVVPRQSSPSRVFERSTINRSGGLSNTSPIINRSGGINAPTTQRSAGSAFSGRSSRAVQRAPQARSSRGAARSRGR